MSEGATLVLNGGGLRSLVATAVALADTEPRDVVLVHLRDGRPNAAARADHVRRQSRHYDINRLIEMDLPHLQTELHVPVNEDGGASPLSRPQVLLAGLGQAARLRAQRLIWPMQIDADFATVTRLTEQVVLVEHLAQLEQQTAAIEMPLLELTDQQLIELGAQLEVPWPLAWTCALAQDKPCMTCGPCRHRHRAFESAGIVDPIEQQPVLR